MRGIKMPALEIHHINVNDGDCTLILLDNAPVGAAAPNYTRAVLIDGGNLSPTQRLAPYLNSIFPGALPALTSVILSHHHKDHYEGLKGLGNGQFRTIDYIDLGGYNLNAIAPMGVSPIQPPQPFPATPLAQYNPPLAGPGLSYLKKLKLAASGVAVFGPTIAQRQRPMYFPQDVYNINFRVGVLGGIGTGVALQPIYLGCIVGSGYTMTGPPPGPVIPPTPQWVGGGSPNNFCLGWILMFGEFRYFSAGDIGGYTAGAYTDQETQLLAPLQSLLTNSYPFNAAGPGGPYNGHFCAWKTNHHGSNESNNQAFIDQARPAVTVTSAGSNAGWHLPGINFLNRLAGPAPVPFPGGPTGARTIGNREGFFFTNLHNFPAGNSLTVANNLFGTGLPPLSRTNAQNINVPTDFLYGNSIANPPPRQEGYIIRVPYTTNTAATPAVPQQNPPSCSVFEVYRSNINGIGSPSRALIGNYECHC